MKKWTPKISGVTFNPGIQILALIPLPQCHERLRSLPTDQY